MKITIKQYVTTPTAQQLDALSYAILVLPPSIKRGRWPRFPYAAQCRQRVQRWPEAAREHTTLVFDLPNTAATRVAACILPDTLPAFEALTLARQLIAAHLPHNPREIGILLPGLSKRAARRTAEALVAASSAAAHAMPSRKRAAPPAPRLKRLHLFNLPERLDLRRTLAEATGNNLARYLTALPPNELTPRLYGSRIRRLAGEHGWTMHFYDRKALQRKGAGAFLAVAQGSPRADAGIVHLHYTPKGKREPARLALVGKGICFDTGGMNLKPAKYMHGMHEDMAGSAVALGTLLALTELRVPFAVDCWLALAENHIGPHAYKQNDIVTAVDGTTIEVIHTDAEGRMVLADTLALARGEHPQLLIDYATLTGACIGALGTRYSGAFTNRQALIQPIMTAGQESGERVWPFPMDSDYEDDLRSNIADVKQCTLGSEPDHILAARFLNRFVGDTPWVHLDLSAINHKSGLAHIPTDTTGFGVRFTLQLLLEHKAMSRA